MKHHLIEIKNDLFSIAKRLKKINSNFVVCFNKLNQSYELYSKRFGRLIFETNLGEELTKKAVLYAQKNSVVNFAKIIAQIDAENEKLQKEIENERRYVSKQILKELILFADKQSGDVDFSNEKIL